ncbi:MAG: PEP-CTERM sorting domain-containing protein [Sphingomonadales bacterium]|nr:PEP-CTERM sorting domain-containing protein [Sphingomonadales bacterium]
MKTIHALLRIASLAAIAAAAPANATVLWDGSGANDSVSLTQFGASGTNVASGTTFVSLSGITGAVTSTSAGTLQRRDQSAGWDGNFASGAPVLWNLGTAGDITFTFDTAVSAVGAKFQTDIYGPFTARILLSDNSFFDVAGVSNANGDDSAIFIGAQNAIANITGITFHEQIGPGANNFAIGNLSLRLAGTGNGAVPEPATWAMMLIGFAAVGSAMRRRKPHARVRFAF